MCSAAIETEWHFPADVHEFTSNRPRCWFKEATSSEGFTLRICQYISDTAPDGAAPKLLQGKLSYHHLELSVRFSGTVPEVFRLVPIGRSVSYKAEGDYTIFPLHHTYRTQPKLRLHYLSLTKWDLDITLVLRLSTTIWYKVKAWSV